MRHYVYRITNIKINKHYYGTRTSKNREPKEDLGIFYFSSSSDKDFIKDQKENPKNYKYKIINILDTRNKALSLEIKLHNKFNVGVNEKFYNKSKQTSSGFDTTGITSSYIMTEEHKRKVILINSNKVVSDKTKLKMKNNHADVKGENHPMFGRNHSEKAKELIGLAQKGSIPWNKGIQIKQDIVRCPHCNKEGGKSNMTRYHFDNCKYVRNY